MQFKRFWLNIFLLFFLGETFVVFFIEGSERNTPFLSVLPCKNKLSLSQRCLWTTMFQPSKVNTESMHANLAGRGTQGCWRRFSRSAGQGPISTLLPGERLKLMACFTISQILSCSCSAAEAVLTPHDAQRNKKDTTLHTRLCLFVWDFRVVVKDSEQGIDCTWRPVATSKPG